ncbi:MAG: TCR/Tet family MFS transporter [Alphaproteobacteria bacterium]|nr:TCR/Tet family MFS transporter [Alphaproteobacteria bacterium]
MPESRAGRHALVFIFITVLIDVIGLGIVIPIVPKLIAGIAHVGLSDAARYGGWMLFTYAGMQFLCAPAIGNLSDRIGRRPVLILSLVAIGIDYTITGLARTMVWLFVARALSGMAGASYTTANAYIADVTPPEKRAASFGLIGAAFGLGFIIGPAIGGLLGQYDEHLPFFVSAGLAFCNALYGFLVLKESHAPEHRRKFEWWRANPLGALMALRRFPVVLPLCGVVVLARLAHDSSPSTWTYYTMLKFHWTVAEVSYSLMAVGLITAIAFGTLPRLVPRLGERRAVYIGFSAGALATVGYATASQPWMLYAWMVVGALTAFVMPALNTIMSTEVGPTEQGELQGAIASIASLTSVGAPVLMSYLFALFTGPHAPFYFPGASFAAASLCLVLAAVVFTLVKPGTAPARAAEPQSAE